MEPSFNGPFPSCLLPLNQNGSTCKTIHMEMCSPTGSFSSKLNSSVSSERFCKRTRFETEGQGNSVMAYRAQSNFWSSIMFDWLGCAFKTGFNGFPSYLLARNEISKQFCSAVLNILTKINILIDHSQMGLFRANEIKWWNKWCKWSLTS